MGNIINPLGGRLGFISFWSVTWPIFFNKNSQNIFFQLSVQLRILFSGFFYKVFSFNPNHFSANVLHGMILKLTSNFWGFNNQFLSVFLRFFDYKLSVTLLHRLATRKLFFKRLFLMIRKFSLLYGWMRGNPNTFSKNHGGFLAKPFLYNPWFTKLHSKLKLYIKRGCFFLLDAVKQRLTRWHYNLILYTKPFFFFISKILRIKKCFIFTQVIKSTVSASMIVRYMVLKLKQGFTINFVLNNIRRSLKQFLNNFSGYKLCLSGRFTRKQIATYRWIKFGDVTLNQRASGIEYVQDGGLSKFGLFGIKFWIFKHPIINKHIL